jgi:hypothetical protein
MTKHLFIPIIDNGGGLSRTSWALSLAVACLSVLRDYKVTFQSISYPYPDGAMNIATADFLESGADEMIVIDTDIIFSRDHLAMLLSHDVPIVFGLYPKKEPGLNFPAQELDGDANPFADDGRANLREVARTARGFMRVKRGVFEAIAPEVESYTDAQSGREQRLFWKTLPGGHSEDFAFCDLIRKHGFRVMVDRRICTQHEGAAVYPIPGTY